MPFELRSPSGLWLLSLLVPLVLLYILKMRRRKQRVASTWLWAEARRDLLAKSPFKRLVVQVPLILQLLALLLLAFALAQPATRGGAITGDHVAIVVDTSASMSARQPDGTTRMEQAREAARSVVQALGPGADALVIEAGSSARVASPLDRDTRRLEAAVERLRAQEVRGRLGEAIALASDRLRQLPGSKRIVVVTDGALADPEALSTATLPLDVIRVGSPVNNAAIVRVDVRTGVDPATKEEQVQAFALVANLGATNRDLFVTLRQLNVKQPLASRRIQLAPGERSPVVLTFEPTRGDRGTGLVVELSPQDALAVDDRAYGRVPAGRKLPVVVAPADANPWVKRALLADPDVELMTTSVAELPRADVPPDAMVVVDGACPSLAPGGDLLVLDPPAGACRTAVVGKPMKELSITSWAEADPRLRFLTLDGVELLEARRIETEGPNQGLVRTRDGVVVSDISVPGRTGTLVGFDVGESNWPLKASFVLFVRNLVELARTHRARGVTGPATTGEPIRVRVPPDVNALKLVRPDGSENELSARMGIAVVPEASRAGFYHVSWQGQRPGSVLVAANLTSEAESDLGEKKLEANQRAIATGTALEKVDAHTDWRWLLAALALALIVFDVWWLTRRPKQRTDLEPSGRPRLPDRPRKRAAARGSA